MAIVPKDLRRSGPVAGEIAGRGAIAANLETCVCRYGVAMSQLLVRPRHGKIIAGVCAAIADRFGLSTGLVRLGFVLFGLFGVGEIVYIALWVVIPKE